MVMKPKTKLPEDPNERVAALVERSSPSTSRPRLSDELEKQLEPLDRASAACYAAMEDRIVRLRQLREKLEQEDEAIPVEIDENDSLVNHIEDAMVSDPEV